MTYPRSPHEKVGGIVYFGRMLDKIRLKHSEQLPPDLHQNLGGGFDKRCVDFLQVAYEELARKVIEGFDDRTALEWCFSAGQQPSAEQIYVWNEFMRKRGWKDEGTEMLERRKRESGLENRDDILTMFDYIDVDERRVSTKEVSA